MSVSTDLASFDRIDLDELREFKSARDAQARFLKNFDVITSQRSSSWFHAVYKCIFKRVITIPDCLLTDFQSASETFGVTSPISDKVYFILGENGGSSGAIRYDDDVLIVLDRNLLLRAILFVFFVGHSMPIASVILVLSAIRAEGPLPFQEDLFQYAYKRNETNILAALKEIVDFVALHELGHLSRQAPLSLLKLCIRHSESAGDINKIMEEDIAKYGGPDPDNLPPHRRFGIYQILDSAHFRLNVLRPRIEDPWSIVIDSKHRNRIEEWFADTFGIYSRSILDSSGGVDTPRVLAQVPGRITILNYLFFYLETIRTHREGISSQVNLRRFKETQGYKDYSEDTHPTPLSRLTLIAFHCEQMYSRLNIAPDQDFWCWWKRRNGGMWNYGFLIRTDMIIDYLKTCSEKRFEAEATAFDNLNSYREGMYTGWSDICKALVTWGYGELIGLMITYTNGKIRNPEFEDAAIGISKRAMAVLDQEEFGSQLGYLAYGLSACAKDWEGEEEGQFSRMGKQR